MRYLLLSAALCAAVATMAAAEISLVGSAKCTYGPSYWCRSLQQSAECQATAHCARKYWSKLHLKPDHDDVCTICKNMVKQARDVLNSNETLVR